MRSYVCKGQETTVPTGRTWQKKASPNARLPPESRGGVLPGGFAVTQKCKSTALRGAHPPQIPRSC
eukprot:5536835-Karenia_brevis.AAC.1